MSNLNIKLDCQFKNKTEALESVLKTMSNSEVPQKYLDSIFEREKQASFNLGNQIAIPHGTYEASKLLTESKMFFDI
ncbi:Phosphotransferase system PTS,Mannitol Permease IIA Component [Spiroplasma clarkii]|uniref:PTS sugar transporter subunit IIA n=1 Tax=Spiroplasma clarkii TaxID=2139 RepID=UPI000B581B15|nr:PTS sugar transporter subunit IIA [Spiroplasma clarkii]ARU91019.1 Phosphotransferase system PTS,Mannitol Permease IIA Component [Spiroplasma clarkii]